MLIGPALFASVLGSGSFAQTRDEPDAASVVRQAFDRYHTSWYRSLSFIQRTIRYAPGGEAADTAIWYEAYEAPGRLRIDVAPLGDRTMFLFANDSHYVFRHDTLVSARRLIHPLLLLGFDLYFLDPETTLQKLAALGIDGRVAHHDLWHQRPVVVVGARKGDTTSPQFWMDAERLVFVRLLMPSRGGFQETQFNRYERLDGGWIAPEVLFAVDGRIVLKELYDNVRVGSGFDPAFFDPVAWRTARHWLTEE